MNSMFSRSRVIAAAAVTVAMAALAGCNAVEDVREDPTIASPPPKVVLKGSVTGLGAIRTLGLQNNDSATDILTTTAPVPQFGVPNADKVDFSFGGREVLDKQGNPVPYSVTIVAKPYGKNCVFDTVNGSPASGVLTAGTEIDIHIVCTPNVPTFDVTVALDPVFATAVGSNNEEGAHVILTTEEGIFERTLTPAEIASRQVVFLDKLFNGAGTGSPIGSPNFAWSVSATTQKAGGVLNRCPVLRPNGVNPTADIAGATAPLVGACSFTIKGNVYYSRPAEVTADPTRPAGLTLELRNLGGVVKGTASVPTGAFPAEFTFNNTDTPSTTAFTSNQDADFQVVVTTHPTGQTCIVGDGGYVSLKSLIQLNPVSVTGQGTRSDRRLVPTTAGTSFPNVAASNAAPPTGNQPVVGTRLAVFCRNAPAPANVLNGVYRLTKTVAQMYSRTDTRTATTTVTAGPVIPSTETSTWTPFDFTVQNTASNNILTFFADGTFIYGTHALTTQAEHGFYDYSATALALAGASPGRLRFTIISDSWPETKFPGNFSGSPITAAANTRVVTAGLSALPGALTYSAAPSAPYPIRHVNLGNVVKSAAAGSVPAKITGRAGPWGGNAASISAGAFTPAAPIADPVPAAPAAAVDSTAFAGVAKVVDWELSDVTSVNGELTGGWITQDHRRFWVWDKGHTYGLHAGVNGLMNLESACFTVENGVAPSGTIQRRSALVGCYPINRPATGGTYASNFLESVDNLFFVTTNALTTATSCTTTACSNPAAVSGAANLSGDIRRLGDVAPGIYSTLNTVTRFPNYAARYPGAFTTQDGRSPSPNYYHVGPAATFFSTGPRPDMFPQPTVAFTTWCTTEILGIRATLNGVPDQQVIYMCRTRAQ